MRSELAGAAHIDQHRCHSDANVKMPAQPEQPSDPKHGQQKQTLAHHYGKDIKATEG